jgi:hypothetical protein
MITVEQERARLLRERLGDAGLAKAAATVAEVPWRSHGVILQAVFFVPTCVGLAAFYWFLQELHVPKPGLFAGSVAIVLAEFLIHNRRWFGTGVEAALWLGGLYAMISELPSSGRPEALLVLGAAPAVAGIRLRNPLFGALSAVFLVLYFEEKFDLGVMAALLIATLAALALLRTWQRPSTEWLWIAVAVVLPVAGYTQADEFWREFTILLFAGYGLLTLILGLRRRHHALLLSAGVAIGIAMIEIGVILARLPLEAKLALAGAALLGGSWILSRALHDRTTGIVVTPAKLTHLDDAIEIAGTINIPQPDIAPAAPKPTTDGGKFGGAGSTGSY